MTTDLSKAQGGTTPITNPHPKGYRRYKAYCKVNEHSIRRTPSYQTEQEETSRNNENDHLDWIILTLRITKITALHRCRKRRLTLKETHQVISGLNILLGTLKHEALTPLATAYTAAPDGDRINTGEQIFRASISVMIFPVTPIITTAILMERSTDPIPVLAAASLRDMGTSFSNLTAKIGVIPFAEI
jgi:hypothetical protein